MTKPAEADRSKAEAQPSKPQVPAEPSKQEEVLVKDDWASTLAYVMEWLKTKEPAAAAQQEQPKQQPAATPAVPEQHHQANSSVTTNVIGSVKNIFSNIRAKPSRPQHQTRAQAHRDAVKRTKKAANSNE
jgi:hypothetical protein